VNDPVYKRSLAAAIPPVRKSALARKFLEDGKKPIQDAALNCLSAGSQEYGRLEWRLATALEAVDELNKDFVVDALEMKPPC